MENSQRFVGLFDVSAGVFKSFFFGAAIALIACHRGFHCEPGAEGVGRAATKAFVASFVAIMLLNLLLGMFLDGLYYTLWPEAPKITS
jgi:phospholipid/cholesterol/gamma-HCH transport system permease protein